jgi:hypothetical protein
VIIKYIKNLFQAGYKKMEKSFNSLNWRKLRIPSCYLSIQALQHIAYDRTGISGKSYAVFLFHCHLIQPPAKLWSNSARASSLGYLFFPGSRSHCGGRGEEGTETLFDIWISEDQLAIFSRSSLPILGLQTVYRSPLPWLDILYIFFGIDSQVLLLHNDGFCSGCITKRKRC